MAFKELWHEGFLDATNIRRQNILDHIALP